jgi:FixJ family two-component response regulator
VVIQRADGGRLSPSGRQKKQRNTAPATIAVVDDDAAIREALQSLLASVGLQTETFGSAQEFLAWANPEKPSCFVLDVRLPGKSGLDLYDELRQAKIHVPVIFITAYADVRMTVRAVKSGAVDVLQKPFRDQELLDAIQLGIERDRMRREQEKQVATLRKNFELLTAREREVMAFVIRGRRNRDIAAHLGVSEITVKAHRAKAMRKMEAASLVDLVRKADRLGLGSDHDL